MTTHILFIQGAGRGAYDADKRLAESLQRALGPNYQVRYPAMPNEDDANYEEWRREFETDVAATGEPLVLVGHSVGASMLIKWVSE